MKRSFVVFLLVSVLHTSLSDLPVCVHEPDSLCFDPTCATPLFDAHAGEACACNDDNIGVKFLPCDTTTNTMEMIYFWRPPATCIGGVLPMPISGIPCNISCPAGAKLNLTTLECDSCGAGSISTGGGHTWSSWIEWPAQFSTHCAIGGSGVCSNWRLLGDHVDSGNNFNANYLESVLVLDVYLAENGTVSFQYTVSAEEGYDGLYFVIDDVSYLFKSNAALTTYTQNIPAGYHSIQWQYYKDFSVTAGQDRAAVYGITINGLTPAQVTCDECPLGSYQNLTGQSSCTPCAPDTYNDDTVGAAACKPCPDFTYSLAGATACIPKRTCNTTADLTWYYTPCVNGFHTKVYTLVSPPACDIENFVLPANVSESCTPTACLPGQYLSSGTCLYCIHGTAGDGNSCTDCVAGQSGSLRVRYFNNWSTFPLDTGAAYTGCDGNCFTGGWRLGQYFIDSGLGHGQSSLSWFEIDVELWRGSSISFTYAIPASYQNQLIFSVNGFNFAYFRGDNCTYQWNTWQRRIFWSNNWDPTVPRLYNFRWTYVKNDGTVTSDCDRAIITSINITGIAEGAAGSASCQACASGSYAGFSGQERCDQCSPGLSSLQGATNCFACSNDTITDLPGTPYCIPCGSSTVANAGATACEYNCSMVQFDPLPNSGLTEPTGYDMAQLPDIWSIEYGDGVIYGSLCGHNPMCNNETYVCYVGNDSFIGYIMLDMGRIASITELAGNSGVQYEFQLGDTFGFGFRQNQTTCTTILNIRCDPAVQTGTPVVYDDTNFNTQCQMVLAWNSVYGCPFCTSDDYSYTDGDCTDGNKMRHYYWTNSLCVGGSALPADGPVACTRQVSFNQSSVIAGVVVAVVVAAGVAVVVGILYFRNKKLAVAYRDLKSHTLPSETEQ